LLNLVIVEFAIGGIVAAAAIALVLGYRAFRIPRPTKLEMPGGRWVLLYRLPRGPQATVVVLHPYTGDALTTAKYSGFLQAAIPRGFNVVVPEGIAKEWRDSPDAHQEGIDDVAFIASLTERLVAEGIADRKRIFIAGISNGGMMAFAVACARPDLFAGIGTISGGMPRHVFENCRLAKPMPLIMINGDADDVLPYAGGKVGDPSGFFRTIAGVEQTAALFAGTHAGGSNLKPQRTRVRDGKRLIERIDWPNGSGYPLVTVVKVLGGGHDVIGWRAALPAFFALPPRSPATAAAIVRRFADVHSGRS
jgi:polyhydroxybutyrate depolymerase